MVPTASKRHRGADRRHLPLPHDPDVLRWAVALAFFAVALWALKPDRLDDNVVAASRAGVFAVTTMAFFVAEMGDKTQIATAILAARYDALAAVSAGLPSTKRESI